MDHNTVDVVPISAVQQVTQSYVCMCVYIKECIYILKRINICIHTYIYVYILFFNILFVMVYPRRFDIVPCAIYRRTLFFHSKYNSLHLLTPNSLQGFLFQCSFSGLGAGGHWRISGETCSPFLSWFPVPSSSSHTCSLRTVVRALMQSEFG